MKRHRPALLVALTAMLVLPSLATADRRVDAPARFAPGAHPWAVEPAIERQRWRLGHRHDHERDAYRARIEARLARLRGHFAVPGPRPRHVPHGIARGWPHRHQHRHGSRHRDRVVVLVPRRPAWWLYR